MRWFWSKCLVTLAATGLFAFMAQAQLAEFNAINAAARAARESGDQAAYLANVRKLAAFTPGHPLIQIALARGLALDGDGAGAVAQLNRIPDLGLSFGASDDTACQSLKADPGLMSSFPSCTCELVRSEAERWWSTAEARRVREDFAWVGHRV